MLRSLMMLFLSSCCLLLADSLSPSELSTVLGCAGGPPGICGPLAVVLNNQVPGGPINGATSVSVGGGNFSMSGTADSSFGVLKASASATLSDTVSPVEVAAVGVAGFTDIITVNFAPFTGQQGFMELGYTLDGSLSQSGSLTSVATVTALVNGQNQQWALFNSSASGVFPLPHLFSFTYGTPFSLEFDLGATVATANPQVVNGALVTGDYSTTLAGSGTADFSDTFVLSEFNVFDSQMNPVDAAAFTSASGTQYTVNGVVPEPSTLPLSAVTLLCVFAFRQRMSVR